MLIGYNSIWSASRGKMKLGCEGHIQKVQRERFLRWTGPMGRRVLKFDGPLGRGLWIALRAMLIKSALRIYLSVSYVMIGILLTGSLRSPPPIRAAPDFPLCRGQNKTP